MKMIAGLWPFFTVLGILFFGVLLLNWPTTSPTKAKAIQTANGATSLNMALAAYFEQYGKFPDAGTQEGEVSTDGPAGTRLLTILLGKEEVGREMQNPRQAQFLTTKANKNKAKGGLVYNNGGMGPIPEGLYDAWGEPFLVYLRKSGSAKLDFSYQGKGVTLDQPVAILSKGPDKKLGTRDDIKTW